MSLDIKDIKISDKSDRKKGVVTSVTIEVKDSLSNKQVKDLIQKNIKVFTSTDNKLKEKVFDYLLDGGFFGGNRSEMQSGLDDHNEEEGESFEFEDLVDSLWDDFELSLEGVDVIENKNGVVKVELAFYDEILRDLNKTKKKELSR